MRTILVIIALLFFTSLTPQRTLVENVADNAYVFTPEKKFNYDSISNEVLEITEHIKEEREIIKKNKSLIDDYENQRAKLIKSINNSIDSANLMCNGCEIEEYAVNK